MISKESKRLFTYKINSMAISSKGDGVYLTVLERYHCMSVQDFRLEIYPWNPLNVLSSFFGYMTFPSLFTYPFIPIGFTNTACHF